jgi:hypothetical protein
MISSTAILALLFATAAIAVVFVEAGGATRTAPWRSALKSDPSAAASRQQRQGHYTSNINGWIERLVNPQDCSYNRTRLEQVLLLNSGASVEADRLNEDMTTKLMDQLAECYEAQVTSLLQTQNEELAFQERIRTSISAELENHTCADPDMTTSTPLRTTEWHSRPVHILHDRPSSQIHVLENFISPEECNAIQEAAAKKLHRGTVADGKGGHQLSQSRKAWQAGISYRHRSEEDPIRKVIQRIYDYTNDAVGYNISLAGQEDLMSIQYFGKNASDTAKAEAFDVSSPDQYRPHCDGECDGLPHKEGGRVATMVMYCDVPTLGGATNFQNSNVYIKPELGAAAFFSYMNPETHHQETGFTSHSGCPVLEGTKRIAVHWMRIGVDEENPWSSFNTLTIKRDEE